MGRPTLLAQLLRIQTLVVALSCALLVTGAMTGAGVLLRRDQDEGLRTIAGTLCKSVEGRDTRAAAESEFGDAKQEGYGYELIERSGSVSVSAGDLIGWRPPGSIAPTAGCFTIGNILGPGDHSAYRACEAGCKEGFRVRAITIDVLSRPAVDRVAWVVLGALPVAILAGAWAGLFLFRKMLVPLQQLEEAASRLEARPGGVALGVQARSAELAGLETAFDNLLARLGEAWAREKRFSQEASHELRTPLTVLRARLERLQKEVSRDGEMATEVSSAIEDIDSLDRLVDALLLLARSEQGQEGLRSDPVNLCDLARDAAHRQQLADGADGKAPEVVAPDEILVRGNEELLARALGNLLENSRKFAGRSAKIRIRVTQEDGQGVVTVEDDGPGISPEHRPLVFDRFFRSPSDRNRVPGSGLGLAVVQAIVRRHGGEVKTGSAALGGEEVRISLPILRQGL
jgi:signal transduction histidine kinase